MLKRQPTAALPPQEPGHNSNHQGWIEYMRGNYAAAADLFQQAVQQDAADLDSWFALGLAQKRLQRADAAQTAFETVIAGLPKLSDPTRASMLYRLARGHINHLQTGDWRLNQERWQPKP